MLVESPTTAKEVVIADVNFSAFIKPPRLIKNATSEL